MELTITFTDGTETSPTEVTLGDIVAFERKFGITFGELDMDKFSMEQMAFLAWNGQRRVAGDERTFDDFIDALADFDVEGGAPLAQQKEG